MMKRFKDIAADIQDAYSIIHRVAHHTPLVRSNTFSRLTGGEIHLKLECLQRTGSFKVRGAYYALSKLGDEVKKRGCVTASAGNHAQGVAYAASSLGVRATIVMPEFAPMVKVQATLGYGAEVVRYGRTYDEAVQKAHKLCETRKAIFIHSFDDLQVITGQGTIGLEMMDDASNLDTIVVPVGGGGLISGVAIAIKHVNPTVRIYGVQALGAPSMVTSLKKNQVVEIPNVDTIADGIAIKQPSPLTFNIIKELVDEVFLVDDDEIANAIFMLLERSKQVAEPAGAVGLAALLSKKIDVTGKKVGVVISGGNIDLSLLARIVERALYKERRFVKIAGLLPDRPGALQNVLAIVASIRANVVTIEHDRTDPQIYPGKAVVTITVEVPEIRYVKDLREKLKREGYQFSTIVGTSEI